MTATVTDLFCGAGGSSLGAVRAGANLVMAANHWQTAIDVHQAHFPEARHDCADITQVDPRRYPRTNILIASPECTNHSQARGVSRRSQQASLFDEPDPAAERSRATMWDVVRFAEQMRYEACIIENVVEATKWVLWPAWCQAMTSLGYRLSLCSHNSMHHAVPQSRDRIYAVWCLDGIRPDLDMELTASCPRCERPSTVRQAWKNGHRVGRYRQQWVWQCIDCRAVCEPATAPAASIIDWERDCPRIGDRDRPLAAATRARILAGLQRYGWAPITTSGAGNVFERVPGNRARSIDEPLPVQQTTATTALATPPGFLIATGHGGRVADLDAPHPTVCASDDRRALVTPFVVPMRSGRNRSHRVDEPLATVAAGGNYGGLVVPLRSHTHAQPTDEALPTVTAGGNHHGLLMRNNLGGAEMVTPTDEPARTMTTKGHQSLLVPYYGHGTARTASEPIGTVRTRDGWSLVDAEQVVDDCGFRMLEPYEVAAAMAFPVGYIDTELTKKDQVKLAGNAVTPPVMTWLMGRVLQALEVA
jgi:DNA (cytosine-5)-methyltransferase 1